MGWSFQRSGPVEADCRRDGGRPALVHHGSVHRVGGPFDLAGGQGASVLHTAAQRLARTGVHRLQATHDDGAA